MLAGMSLLRTAIGSVLRRFRLRQGRTLRDVADVAGISMPYLSEIERGRKEASSEILASICRALGIGLPDLLEEVRLELLRIDPAVAPPRLCAGRIARGGVRRPRPRAVGACRRLVVSGSVHG
jgi:transcriptional regulator with XRE-family HTH domain